MFTRYAACFRTALQNKVSTHILHYPLFHLYVRRLAIFFQACHVVTALAFKVRSTPPRRLIHLESQLKYFNTQLDFHLCRMATNLHFCVQPCIAGKRKPCPHPGDSIWYFYVATHITLCIEEVSFRESSATHRKRIYAHLFGHFRICSTDQDRCFTNIYLQVFKHPQNPPLSQYTHKQTTVPILLPSVCLLVFFSWD